MPSLKSLKNRIKSVKSTQKITKAMKMVAASKLKRAREKAEAATPYANKMHDILINVAKGVSTDGSIPNLLHGNGKSRKYLFLVISADRGLCGAFNLNIVKLVRKQAEKLLSENKEVKFIIFGKKAYELLRKQYSSNIIFNKHFMDGKSIVFHDANTISHKLISMFQQEQFDILQIFYSKFETVITQIPSSQQLIPLSTIVEDNKEIRSYEYEPCEEQILNELLPKNLAVQIYKSMLETSAGEQGSRMTAMDSATRNSGEMIKKLSLVYNRTRQAFITKELIEIISGAEAV